MGCHGCRICRACRELSRVLRWGTELGNADHFFPGGNGKPPWGQISGGSRAGKHYIPQCLAGIWVEKIGNSLVLMVQWQVLQAMTEKLPLGFILLRQGWCHVLPPCGFSLLLAPSWPFFLPFPPLLMSSPSAPLLSTISKLRTCCMMEGWDGRRASLQQPKVGFVLFMMEGKNTSKGKWKASRSLAARKSPVWTYQLWVQADVRQLLNCLLLMTHYITFQA